MDHGEAKLIQSKHFSVHAFDSELFEGIKLNSLFH